VEKVTTYTGHFVYIIFLASHTDVIQETTVMYEFSTWFQEKIIFKNTCWVREEHFDDVLFMYLYKNLC